MCNHELQFVVQRYLAVGNLSSVVSPPSAAPPWQLMHDKPHLPMERALLTMTAAELRPRHPIRPRNSPLRSGDAELCIGADLFPIPP